MNWKNLFDAEILNRGLYYYEQDLVVRFQKREREISAEVSGNEIYTVEISIADDTVIDMYCSCPYAADGNNCKHMAAVLFYAEDDIPENDKIPGATHEIHDAESAIDELVNNADVAKVKDFLIDILKENPLLLQQFKLTNHCAISSADIKVYTYEIDAICKRYADNYGYISYSASRGFDNALSEFLQKTIMKIIGNGAYSTALELIRYVFMKLGKIEIDDSNGTTGALAYRCVKLLQAILQVCDSETKKTVYRECKSLLTSDMLDYLKDYIKELLFSDFDEDEFLQDKLAFSEMQTAAFLRPENDFAHEYAVQTWVTYHLQVMKQLHFPQKEIDNYCKKYIRLSGIRTYYIDECVKMKRYEEAVQLLEEGKLIDKGYRGLILAYSKKLKEIYAETGQHEKYKDELWHIVLEYDPGDLDTYKELKTYYTADEWEEKREIIFKQNDIRNIDALYAYDGLYDRLLKLALEEDGLYYIIEYEDVLKNLAPEKILKRYEAVVRKKAEYTSDRAVYQEIAELLKRMQRYPDGKELVQTLIAEFRSAYRRRPAMMQELDAV